MLARLVLALVLCCEPATAADIVGRVVGVTDGDTLTVLVGRKQVKVRLAEIDAPESKQPYGTRSKQSLSELAYNKTVRVVDHGTDRYRRTLGRVYVGNVDVNAEQVRRGMAWVFDRYVTDKSLYALQDEARANKRGLWADPRAMPPWECGKSKR